MNLFPLIVLIMKCRPLNVNWSVELRERHSVAACGEQKQWEGAAAAEKQQSLQSLICKYANDEVIKIGR